MSEAYIFENVNLNFDKKEKNKVHSIVLQDTNGFSYYSSQKNNLHELSVLLENHWLAKQLLHSSIYSIVPTIDTILKTFEKQNLRFGSTDELSRAFVKEMLNSKYANGEEIPKIIHHFWAGEQLSPVAMSNIYAWMYLTQKYHWKHFIWTDSNVNKIYNDKVLKSQFQLFSLCNISIVDISNYDLQIDEEELETYDLLLRHIPVFQKKLLPYLSDLIRYNRLFHVGGIYIDVDIHPGSVDLCQSLKHWSRGNIPLLAPGFRTQRSAQYSGYYDFITGRREITLFKMYKYHILGNQFIATKPFNDILKVTSHNLMANLKHNLWSSGPSDILKAIKNYSILEEKPIEIARMESIPSWLFDCNWVTIESDSMVN